MRIAFALALAGALVVPGASQAADPVPSAPVFGKFRSVLAQGEGRHLNTVEFGQYTAFGTLPPEFTSQNPLYAGVLPVAPGLQTPDLDKYWKPTDFGSMPGGAGSQYSPRPGVTVYRDATYGMAHIYGDTRADLMFGAGYATAEERLFAMDALRHVAKGKLSELTGPGSAEMDGQQLTDQNFTDDELRKQFNDLPAKFGPIGARGKQDVLDYIAGINARIAEVRSDPSRLPAEYAALNISPADWDVSDTVAMAVLLVTQFTVSNGGEERNSQMRLEFQKKFGNKLWRKRFNDFREADDPETFTVSRKPTKSDRPGKVKKGVNLIPDLGSIKPFNPQVSGSGSAQSASMADWVRRLTHVKSAIPTHASNHMVVGAQLSKSGKPLYAAGPQVDYYSPQIFAEYELHGGGIDATGVTFPGASPWPLIGHGIDFAWSGTSANGDNNDTFVETLCNTDGSAATEKSRAYMYKGKCTPFFERDQKVTTPPPSAGNMSPQEELVFHPLRSVHGPVFAFAAVGGRPVALTKAKGVNFRELDAVLPFMRLAENQATDRKTFFQAFSPFPGTENWSYVDNKVGGFLQSGVYPLHAKGSDVDLPYNGDGTGDWQGFNPDDYTFKSISGSRRPRAVTTSQPIIVSWNQKEAPGWRKGPTEWSDGSVHRAELLYHYLRTEIKAGGGKTDLRGVAKAATEAASTDLRGHEVYPWMRRVIGKAGADDERFLALLDAWSRGGAHRLDENGDNVYENSAAVALFDQWWVEFVRAEFEPGLGKDLFDKLVAAFLPLTTRADNWGWAWSSHVDKDLRNVLGKKVRGRYSRIYCGGPKRKTARTKCRTILLDTLRAAIQTTGNKFSSDDPANWKLAATCEKKDPPACDQNVPTALGAVDTPPFPWQNRGTYHQVVEMSGHR